MKENVAALASELQSQAVDSRGQPAWSLSKSSGRLTISAEMIEKASISKANIVTRQPQAAESRAVPSGKSPE